MVAHNMVYQATVLGMSDQVCLAIEKVFIDVVVSQYLSGIYPLRSQYFQGVPDVDVEFARGLGHGGVFWPEVT
jgi:hypothetical protein